MKQQSFEEKLNTLDNILSEFEKQETLTLEKSLSLYEEGIRLVRECTTVLENAQKRIDALND